MCPQEYDFFCIDENGSVIDSNLEFDDLEDVTQETQEAEINKAHDKLIHTEDSDPGHTSVQDVSDQNNPKTTEQGGSSWIGSAVNGMFGRNEQSNVDESQEDSSDQEPFKSRRISMNIKENHIDEKTNPGTLGWIRGELTNALGFKDSKVDTQDSTEKPKDDKEPSSQKSSSWLSMGMDVLGFGKDDASKPEVEIIHENIDVENQSNSVDSIENIQKHEHGVEKKDHGLEDDKTDQKAHTGWYGTIYNGITDLYSKEQSESDKDEDKDSVSEDESDKSAPNTEDNGNKESESSSQSILSVGGLSSVLDNIKIPFQSDAIEKSDVEDNEQTTNEEDRGKKELDEQTDVSGLDLISEIRSDESMTLKDSDAIGEIKDPSTQIDGTQDNTGLETSEIKSTDHVIEDIIQMENKDREMEQNQQRHLQSEKEKQGGLGGKDFLEHSTSPMDFISETQDLSYDDREMNDTSQDDDTQSKDLVVSGIKSADISIEDVIQSKNNFILEYEMKQNLSDQRNDSDTIMQQESHHNNISYISVSTNPVISSDSNIHTSELPESDPETETKSHDTEKQTSGFKDSDSNIETITISPNKNSDSKTIMDTLSGHDHDKSNDHILAGEDSTFYVEETKKTHSEDVSEDIMKNDETSDLQTLATEISNDYKLNTNENSLDKSENSYSPVHAREENIHSDLEPESDPYQTVLDEKIENTTEPHDGLFEIAKADFGIRDATSTDGSQTNSEGHQDVLMEEQKEPRTFSESIEKDLKTKELIPDASEQNDIQMKNKSLSQEASAKDGLDGEYSLGDSNDVSDGTEDPAHQDVFAENDPKSFLGAEHTSIETDIANNMDNQTKIESDTSATQVQTDVGMTAELVHIQDTLVSSAEIKPSQKLSEGYPNLYSHLSEQNIKDLLDIVGDHKLAWLDSQIGSSNMDTDRDNNDLAPLYDLEQLLEYHINTRRHFQNNDGFPEKDNTNEYPALQKLSFLLSTIRETYTPGKVKVDESPGTDDVQVLKHLQNR